MEVSKDMIPRFASKGLAGAALGLAIPGTIALANQFLGGRFFGGGCGCNNGWGWGNWNGGCGTGFGPAAGAFNESVAFSNALAQKDAEIAMLKSENYSDKVGKDVYAQSLADNRNLRQEVFSFLTPLSNTVAEHSKQIAVLETQQKCEVEKSILREQLLESKLGQVASNAACGISGLQKDLECLQRTVCGITSTIVPAAAICPQPMPQYNSWTAPTGTPTQVSVQGTVNTRVQPCGHGG